MTRRPGILVTRPLPDAETTAAHLRAIGFEPTIAPLSEMHPLEPGLPNPTGLAGIALSSANALRALELRGALADYTHLPAFCVGTRTADFARELGFETIHNAQGTFNDLVGMLTGAKLDGPIFYPMADMPHGDLAAALAPHGLLVIASPVYAMRPVSSLPETIMAALADGRIKAVCLYSRRTAEHFASLMKPSLEKDALRALECLCLSENVAAPLMAARVGRIALADYPSEDAMMALALSYARGQIF